ncbi:hypothetical protein F4821DRAFT_102167 [Hypoxylon rubiginosum]|uniref:Uncharacterized protein n=1 Tax=Hypoxylon rubiginosum TaxID=110542 RepID=A0ACC0D4N9_9PEZI|nr:hypothetical protein F4821DRAFT_102167 [Hypoxylon rubiginosum]
MTIMQSSIGGSWFYCDFGYGHEKGQLCASCAYPQVGTPLKRGLVSCNEPRRFPALIEATLTLVTATATIVMYCFNSLVGSSTRSVSNPLFSSMKPTSPLRYIIEPSLTTFFLAIVVYCIAMGVNYYFIMGSKHHDVFIVCGATTGLLVGFACNLNLQQAIFRVLPSTILTAMLVHSYGRRYLLK